MSVLRSARRPRWIAPAIAMVVLGSVTAACGGSGGSSGANEETASTTAVTSTTESSEATSSSTTGETDSSSPSTTVPAGLPDASEGQHSAPASGEGTALLSEVRIGRNAGFERIVFEFQGPITPGYRIQWVDGPITSDGAGAVVAVDGDAYLEVVMQPASGVDLSAPELNVVYDGPDRIPTTGRTVLLQDLVRTGDFEAVLTWVAGATERVPFRVLTLSAPSRLVIDLETT